VRRRHPAVAVCIALVLALAGCGYTWAGAHRDAGLGRIAIETPENASRESGIEFVVADALRREVLRRSGAELVEDADRADWVVSGRVLPVRVAPASLSPVVLTLEYELTLHLELKARTEGGREVASDARTSSETERYLSSANAEAQRKNRDEALRRVSRMLAARFLDQLDEVGLEDPTREEGS
jgi:hypothetical protein